MTKEGQALAAKAREAAGTLQVRMIPGLSTLFMLFADWVESVEKGKE